MKQVVQPLSAGSAVEVIEVPIPSIGATDVLVRTMTSTISPGTERSITALAGSSLLSKARARPDLVRQVANKARREGVAQAVGAVRDRVQESLPLGYSAAGEVVEVGEAVARLRPGQLVVTAGAGRANHAEYQSVPGLLCVELPDDASPSAGSMAAIASVGLHGLRLADLGPGSRVVVLGLGLVGQLTLRLARAAGHLVTGIDLDPWRAERAALPGVLAVREDGAATSKEVLRWSRGRGADAVIVTAGGKGDVMSRVPELCRDRAEIIVVGDVELNLDRRAFYDKELSVTVGRSYGPGRYETSYEEWGVDFPPGWVRWTEGRNLEAFVDLVAAGSIDVDGLVTHTFDISDAVAAYELVAENREPNLAVQLAYPDRKRVRSGTAEVAERSHGRKATNHEPGVAFIGAGSFARNKLIPAFKAAGFSRFVSAASSTGLSARRLVEEHGFGSTVDSIAAIIADPTVDVVVVATPHSLHASLTASALAAGKHVYCEKPVALTFDELDEVETAWGASGRVLFVGLNRRWSRPVAEVKQHFENSSGPLVVTYRVNAGPVPANHWYGDRREGGRLLGEVCHFIDTCEAVVGLAAATVVAVASGDTERLLSDQVVVTLTYADGSLATIAYAAEGHAATEKERVEVLGRGKSAVISDFRRVTLDKKVLTIRPQDKGHEGSVLAFRRAVMEGASVPDLASSRATLQAAASLTSQPQA